MKFLIVVICYNVRPNTIGILESALSLIISLISSYSTFSAIRLFQLLRSTEKNLKDTDFQNKLQQIFPVRVDFLFPAFIKRMKIHKTLCLP